MGDLGLERSERRGLSSFLAEHEGCDEGFDIQRRQGPEASMVRVICNGCGEALEYPSASTVGAPNGAKATEGRTPDGRVERRRFAPSVNPTGGAPSQAGAGGSPGTGNGGASAGAPAVPPPDEGRVSSWPSWLSTALIAALIGGGLLMVGIGLFGSDDNHSGTPAERSATPVSNPEGSQWQNVLPTTTATTSNRRVVELTRRRFADRIAVGVPRGWRAGVSGGAVTVAAAGGGSQVQVYYEAGARSPAELGRRTREFLAQRHPGARITGPRPTRHAGMPARLVRAAYDDGGESALAFVSNGYTYLVLERISRGASARVKRQGDAVVASVRPL